MQRTQWKMAGQLGFDTGIILGILCYSWSIENNARMMGIFSHKENNNIKTLIFSCMYKIWDTFFQRLDCYFQGLVAPLHHHARLQTDQRVYPNNAGEFHWNNRHFECFWVYLSLFLESKFVIDAIQYSGLWRPFFAYGHGKGHQI